MINAMKIWRKHILFNAIITVPVDGLAPSKTATFAAAVMSKLSSVYFQNWHLTGQWLMKSPVAGHEGNNPNTDSNEYANLA